MTMEAASPLDTAGDEQLLHEQLRWLIRLRWVAAGVIVAAGLVGTGLFPILASAAPIYTCAGILLVTNGFYLLLEYRRPPEAARNAVVHAMFQVTGDLVILTALLHFSGGLMNPCALFYVFHVIIAAIILPRTLSFAVGLLAIGLYGTLAVGEMQDWFWLRHHALQLVSSGLLWKNPVYVLWVFSAFVGMVVLAQYLTRTIIVRVAAKEREATHTRDLLMAVINAMSEGLMFFDTAGTVALCNPAARRWTGRGDSRSALELADFPTELAQPLGRIPSPGATAGEVVRFGGLLPGQRYIEARICPVAGVDGQPLGRVVVGQDLTAHKRLERDLKQQTEEMTTINEMLRHSQAEMAQREKMVAVGQMASGIAHEIGNPLASLSSVVQYLRRRSPDPETSRHLGLMDREVNRISAILRRLLGVARPGSDEQTWTDINQVIENTLSLVRFNEHAREVVFRHVANPSLPTVWLRRHVLEQVLLNLFLNALAALAEKPTAGDHVLEVAAQVGDGKIEIAVRDTGVGMNEDVRRHAFDPFFTTKPPGKGTGLGLYICRNLVEELGGAITLESQPGQGTTVTITLSINPTEKLERIAERSVP